MRWAVEELKTVCSSESRPEFERTVLEMFETFIASESPLAINIDHDTRTDIIDRVENQDPSSFPDNIYERAQAHVYRLMEKAFSISCILDYTSYPKNSSRNERVEIQ
ncbi:regulator of G protein signaling domain protein [Ancylostoma ceylanicum]|uniref:Regulator of G protein signaling domain protein n=1 Tax=Ancylostoma ceylanicum TaxID=53326 RepID=A0A0D6L5M1_9BILA|nr:regulator of G protein signaling domain protein [Ancylostoma ceylanicum]